MDSRTCGVGSDDVRSCPAGFTDGRSAARMTGRRRDASLPIRPRRRRPVPEDVLHAREAPSLSSDVGRHRGGDQEPSLPSAAGACARTRHPVPCSACTHCRSSPASPPQKNVSSSDHAMRHAPAITAATPDRASSHAMRRVDQLAPMTSATPSHRHPARAPPPFRTEAIPGGSAHASLLSPAIVPGTPNPNVRRAAIPIRIHATERNA